MDELFDNYDYEEATDAYEVVYSRAKWAERHLYAVSMGVWSILTNNTVKCLRTLKKEYLEEDYDEMNKLFDIGTKLCKVLSPLEKTVFVGYYYFKVPQIRLSEHTRINRSHINEILKAIQIKMEELNE